MFYPLTKTLQIFSSPTHKAASVPTLLKAIASKALPPLEKGLWGRRYVDGWTAEHIHRYGELFGFMPKPGSPQVYSFFVTKGGVLKSSLSLNMARLSALHGISTLVIGLDMQCDMTHSLGHQSDLESQDNLDQAMEASQGTLGLMDYLSQACALDDLILPTDLPYLHYIPETPELVALEQSLIHKARREFWLRDKVIAPLKDKYSLIILDCSPNWNHLITNALVASDVLVSPLECKINNFRNFKMFQTFVSEFKAEMQLSFQHRYVPTRYSPQRKLSREIKQWYEDNIPECLPLAIRDSVQGEEAIAMHLSISEYAPGHSHSQDLNQIVQSLWLAHGPERRFTHGFEFRQSNQ